MNEINKELFKLERDSFIRHAIKFGLVPNEYAKHLNDQRKRASDRIMTNPPGDKNPISNVSNRNDLSEIDQISELLNHNRKLAIEDIEIFARDLVDFASNHSKQFGVDWGKLKKLALKNSIPIDDSDWPVKYLCNAPILFLYEPEIEASVRYFKDSAYRIIFNKSLDSLIDGLLPPIVIRYLFQDNLDGNKDLFYINRSKVPPFDLYSIADALVATAYWFLNPFDLAGIRERQIKNPAIFSMRTITGFLETLVTTMYWGTYEFVILHELSHLILGHEPSTHNKINEVQADILAYNTMLNSKRFDASILWTEKMTVMLPFRVLGPIILMNFFAVINGYQGWKDSQSHPHPFTRVKYLSLIADNILRNNPRARFNFRELLEPINELFDTTNSRLKIPETFESSLDLKYLNGYSISWVINEINKNEY